MGQWPKDNTADRNAFYGDPAKGEIADQLIPVVPPFAMYFDGKKINSIAFHRKAAPALAAALKEIWDYYGHNQKLIDAAGVSKYAGAYNHRMVRGSSTKWSNHAYGCAIDLNPDENALGSAKGNMPQPVIDAFCRQGWMWGGWYNGRKDPMHFEAVDNGGRVPSTGKPAVVAVAKPTPAKTTTVAAAGTATGAAVVVAANHAAQQGASAIEIIGGIVFLSAIAIGAVVIGYKIIKGSWPWSSVGKTSQVQSPLLPLSSAQSLELASAQLALSSAASPATPSRKRSRSSRPRKQSAKQSSKTRTPRKKSSSLSKTAAKKS